MQQFFKRQDNKLKAERIYSAPSKKAGVERHREPSLLIIFIILVIWFLCMDPSDLPDYEAYERIYEGSLLGEDWEIFFVLVNLFFRQSGFSYSDLRNFILIFCSCALWLTLMRLQPSQLVKATSLRTSNLFLMFFILTVFMFEYFAIRIRAGFSIGFICCAVILFLSSRSLLGWTSASIFLVIAYFTHKSTTVILLVFLGIPFITAMWEMAPRNKNRLFTITSIGCVAFVLYVMNSTYELRGEHIYSPLNPVRFVMLSIVPLIMFFFTRNESKITLLGSGAMKEFPSYFVRFYAVLALGLSLIFFAGQTGESGEALVRLYTLASIPALLSLRLSGSALNAPISAYILVINSLFFLVTVLLPA